MKMLEKSQDKIQQICDLLKSQAIEPGKQEAQRIIEEAQKQAAQIILEAERKAQDTLQKSRRTLESERLLFDNSLKEASKQALGTLRETLENQFFSVALRHELTKTAHDPKVIAELLNAIVKALDREGTRANFTAILPAGTEVNEVLGLLFDDVRERLKAGSVEVGDFGGGVRLKLQDQHLTFDLSENALKELLEKPLRKEFRKWLFA